MFWCKSIQAFEDFHRGDLRAHHCLYIYNSMFNATKFFHELYLQIVYFRHRFTNHYLEVTQSFFPVKIGLKSRLTIKKQKTEGRGRDKIAKG